MAETPQQQIYQITDTSFTSGGSSWVPASILLSLNENGVPSADVVIAPGKQAGDPSTPVETVTLNQITGWNEQLNELASQQARATFKTKITCLTTGEVQELNLVDWVIKSAGIQQASASGVLAVVVTIAHPAELANQGVQTLGNIVVLDPLSGPMWAVEDYTDPLDGFCLAMYLYADLVRTLPDYGTDESGEGSGTVSNTSGAGNQQAIANAQQKMKAAVQALADTIVWSAGGATGNWPTGGVLTDSTLIAGAIPSYVVGTEDSSPFNSFVNGLCQAFQLTVKPTYWNPKLEVSPFSPWAEPDLTIAAQDIATIRYPGTDPQPVGGARVAFSDSTSVDYTSLDSPGGNLLKLMTDVIYLAEATASANNDRPGLVVSFPLPPWLSGIFQASAAQGLNKTFPQDEADQYSANAPGNVGPDTTLESQTGNTAPSESTEQLFQLVLQYAEQIFYMSFRQGVSAMVQTRLLLKSGGEYVCPGRVVSVESDTDYVIFDFYVTNVVHSIDLVNNHAGTEIVGRYARPFGGVSDYVVEGTLNPLYV